MTAPIAAPASAAALLRDQRVALILDLLNDDEEETRIVGGAIRNALLDRPVVEYDLATTAPPDKVLAWAAAAKLRTVPTGLAHGTVTVFVKGVGFEVTSLREDIDTDGRHATVAFGRDFARDAERRDFTINALSLDRHGRLFDYVGGLTDLAAARIRFIGDPERRIREDLLRILRFFRFTADYARGPLDPDGLRAALRARDGLARLSRERVATELFKLLAARRAGPIVREACETGILGPLLALAPDPGRLDRACRFQPESDAPMRLAALCVRTPEDVAVLRAGLRLSNKESRRLSDAAAAALPLHGLDAPPPPQRLREMLFRHGRGVACDALALARLDGDADDPTRAETWVAAAGFLGDTPEPHLPFSGVDLQARGIGAGQTIGRMLKILQARWIAAGFPQDPHTIAQLLDELAREG